MMDYFAKFYSRPYHVGSGVVFSEARRQRGGSVLGALKSMVLPVMRALEPKLIKTVGKIAKRQLFGLATDLLADKVSGKNMTDSLKSRGKSRLLQGAAQGLNTIGNMINPPKARRAAAKKKRSWRFRGSGIKEKVLLRKEKVLLGKSLHANERLQIIVLQQQRKDALTSNNVNY